MNMTATRLCLAVLLVGCGVNSTLQADELGTHDNFFVADETRHQWVNEHSGRTGVLEVRGALLTSPCTLVTNESPLPTTTMLRKEIPLRLYLTGCGDGEDLTVVPSAQVDTRRAQLHGGSSQMTWYMSPAQYRDIRAVRKMGASYIIGPASPGLLRLRMDYE
ncbi:pilus-assembly fibrillin subunit [Escherichia coli]|uniref:pilus-assembly fibrillin subunit n=1 Tax=Escherichia coli TaxID=562 RepID=UPI003A94D9FB